MFGATSRALLLACGVLRRGGSQRLMAAQSFLRPSIARMSTSRAIRGRRSASCSTKPAASCSGVLISRDEVVTAAHCLYNFRTRRFIPAAQLHFLAGYRTGRYAAHVRIARYEIGPGFDPERYDHDLRIGLGGADRHRDLARQHRAAAAAPP